MLSSDGRAVTRSAWTGKQSAVEPCLVLGRPGSVPLFLIGPALMAVFS